MKNLFRNFDYSVSTALAILHDYSFTNDFDFEIVDDEKFDVLVKTISNMVSSYENSYIYENDFENYENVIDVFLENN